MRKEQEGEQRRRSVEMERKGGKRMNKGEEDRRRYGRRDGR
jgi:hypothetical protein